MPLSRQQLAAKKAIDRAGRTVQLIPNAVDASGVEREMDEDETGIVAVKGLFKRERITRSPDGALDQARSGDVEGSSAMEQTMTVAFAALSFVPDISTRVLDGGKTFNVVDVITRYHGEDMLSFKLIIRPL